MYGHLENWIDIEVPNAFKHRASVDRVTSGIWIWSDPIFKKNETGQDIAIFLMDTQGWHDDRSDVGDTSMIFGLSSLLSSVMIINVTSMFGDDDLSFLQTFSTNAQKLSRKDDEQFQKLIFLIRDWTLVDKESGYPFGYHKIDDSKVSRNFIKEKFSLDGKSVAARNLRQLITSSYKKIAAYLMPFPWRGPFANNDLLLSTSLNEHFMENLQMFFKNLFDTKNIIANCFNGRRQKGKDIVNSTQEWSRIFENKVLPDLTDESDYLIPYRMSMDCFEMIMERKLRSSNEEELRKAIVLIKL